MKSISIRNVPDDVYQVLQAMAKVNRRSLQEQVKYLLEQQARLHRGSATATAAGWRRRLQDRKHSDTVGIVRKDRSR